jgi:hypothetical protein
MVFDTTSDILPERVSPAFMRVASICAILSALTTVAVHWLPDLWSNLTTFQLRVRLRQNAVYMGRFWIVGTSAFDFAKRDFFINSTNN